MIKTLKIHLECMDNHMEIDLHTRKSAIYCLLCYFLLQRPSQKLESRGVN